MVTEILKFGGSSVGTLERIQNVANLIKKEKSKVDDLVVVVSAMMGKTDELTNMAHFLGNNPNSRDMDLLLSSGERIASSLLSISLLDKISNILNSL